MIILILGFVLAIISGFLSFQEKAKENSNAQKSNKYNLGIFMALIIGSLMSVISGFQSTMSAKANEDSIKIKDTRYTALLVNNIHKSDSLRNKIDSAKDKMIDLQKQGKQEGDRMRDSLNIAKNQIIDFQEKSYRDLLNNTTGGNSVPQLKLIVAKASIDKERHFILFFQLLRNGKYNLNNVRCSINDFWGEDMLRHGIQYFSDGLVARDGPPIREEIKNYKVVHHFDIGTITGSKEYHLYTATFSSKILNRNSFYYSGEIQWNNGSIMYFVEMIEENDDVKLGHVQILLNGKEIKEHNRFLIFYKRN